jgi:hypothetical protein
MSTILFSAPYMLPTLDRFRPVFERFGLDLITPEVRERLEADEIQKYAGQFDGTICGDDNYPSGGLALTRLTELQLPDLASRSTELQTPSLCRWQTLFSVTSSRLPAANPGWTLK